MAEQAYGDINWHPIGELSDDAIGGDYVVRIEISPCMVEAHPARCSEFQDVPMMLVYRYGGWVTFHPQANWCRVTNTEAGSVFRVETITHFAKVGEPRSQ